MGFFSWDTSDTEETINNVCSEEPHTRPVYMLLPNGQKSIKEEAYEGYGVFGGIDAYEKLAELNLGDLTADMSSDERRLIGIYIDSSQDFYRDENGALYGCCSIAPPHLLKLLVDEEITTFSNYNQKIDGKTINELIENKKLIAEPAKLKYPLKYPLKFSFDESATYEGLPAAAIAENQGFFF